MTTCWLLTANCSLTHHGEEPDKEEKEPTIENVIVLLWLQFFYPDLLRYLKELFGSELRRCALASIRTGFCDLFPKILRNWTYLKLCLTHIPHQEKQYYHQKESLFCADAKRRSCNHFLLSRIGNTIQNTTDYHWEAYVWVRTFAERRRWCRWYPCNIYDSVSKFFS